MKISITENRVKVVAPYHPDFPRPAKQLGGKWDSDSKTWLFDPRDESRVRDLCRKVYGTDGAEATGDLVTLKITAKYNIGASKQGIYLAGRCLASATGRDSGARLGSGVVVLFAPSDFSITSSGSVKNWSTLICEGTILEIRDVPRLAMENLTDEDRRNWDIELIEQEPSDAAMLAEIARLEQRIAEIKAQLVNK